MIGDRIGPGSFIAVVGASGVGKDSVMSFARRALAGNDAVSFVRRTITRTEDAGSERHDSLDRDSFRQAECAGQFALTWEAHGLAYGLPRTLDLEIRTGRLAVANVSRSVLSQLAQRYGRLVAVEITAHRDVLRQRLLARGRETDAEIETRIDRSGLPLEAANLIRIDNSGVLADAGMALVGAIETELALSRSEH